MCRGSSCRNEKNTWRGLIVATATCTDLTAKKSKKNTHRFKSAIKPIVAQSSIASKHHLASCQTKVGLPSPRRLAPSHISPRLHHIIHLRTKNQNSSPRASRQRPRTPRRLESPSTSLHSASRLPATQSKYATPSPCDLVALHLTNVSSPVPIQAPYAAFVFLCNNDTEVPFRCECGVAMRSCR